jgi:hypothetical protein
VSGAGLLSDEMIAMLPVLLDEIWARDVDGTSQDRLPTVSVVSFIDLFLPL